MPDTGAPWNIPYVESTDLVSDWPADSLALANAIAAGLDDAGNAGIGSNVVQAVKTDTSTTTSVSFIDVPGLSVTITPSSSSSRVLLLVNVNAAISPTTNGQVLFQFAGGNSGSYVGDAADLRSRVAFGFSLNDDNDFIKGSVRTLAAVYLDSPSTTSATTYRLQYRRTAGTAFINRSNGDGNSATNGRAASSLTAIEVAA
jgi:hypothetical protein